jgi:hypothetical protein
LTLEIFGAIAATVAILLAIWQIMRDRGRLKVVLQITDAQGSFGLIVDNKDHLRVEAVNIGMRPLVLDTVNTGTAIRWPYLLRMPKFVGVRPLDGPGKSIGGGSFATPRQVDPGHRFIMLLALPAGILFGFERLKFVHLPDSTGRTHRASLLQVLKVRYQLYRQYPEWRTRLKPPEEGADKAPR